MRQRRSVLGPWPGLAVGEHTPISRRLARGPGPLGLCGGHGCACRQGRAPSRLGPLAREASLPSLLLRDWICPGRKLLAARVASWVSLPSPHTSYHSCCGGGGGVVPKAPSSICVLDRACCPGDRFCHLCPALAVTCHLLEVTMLPLWDEGFEECVTLPAFCILTLGQHPCLASSEDFSWTLK